MSSAPLTMRRVWSVGGGLLLLLIFVLSLLPVNDNPDPLLPWFDKLNHMLAFTALMLWFSALVPTRFYPLLFLVLLAYGGLIEILQHFSGYRYMELGDFIADAVGALLGWALALAGMNQWCAWMERRLGRS